MAERLARLAQGDLGAAGPELVAWLHSAAASSELLRRPPQLAALAQVVFQARFGQKEWPSALIEQGAAALPPHSPLPDHAVALRAALDAVISWSVQYIIHTASAL